MTRLSITARLALLAVGLSLVSSLTLAGFVWHQTHDDAIGVLRRDTIEQSDTLAALWRSGGSRALEQAIANAQQPGDESLVMTVVDARGRRLFGTAPDQLAFAPAAERFRIGALARGAGWDGQEAGFAVRPLGRDWLVNGRLLDDWERAQRTLEHALLLAVLLSLVLGAAGGLVLTRYVSRRLNRIAGAVDAVAAGDLTRRVGAVAGGGDAFDRLAGRIDQMLDRIDSLMAELRIVTDSIAHDLRSPIARLRARADAALTAAEPAQRDSALAGLIVETDLVMRMLAVLLEISRSQAMTRDTLQPFSPAELIDEIAELYAPVVEEAGLAFVLTLPPLPPPPLPMHRELLSQALANLIDNALRHAGSGGEIALSLVTAPGEVRIALADRGPGIAPADHAQALSRFGRLDRARSLPGAGLGLALVEAVARLHGGRLLLSDNAPGLVATIVLPSA
ncbi:sensor histidine kinase [Sphingomonas hengshuiensis]|uniref:histidine kinase n=1 Tax=Sphingomonas hengshuiensis TaxID=1609977 RepID=A0A7U4LFT3_9SPHN|nr:HAMP domain-containing sensor histidine kinase [Sphingomonas hengshuiensis]AJP72849.1 signal protein [Sphingomonas hengshuiensis]